MRSVWGSPLATVTLLFAILSLAGCGGGSGGDNSGSNAVTPAPQADAFDWTGNTRLTVSAANGVLANDPGGSVIVAVDNVSSHGGVVSIDTLTGAFTYEPPLGLQNTDDTFTYTVGSHPPTTVTVTLGERIWFVRNNAAGSDLGTDRAPFLTLAQAEAAADVNDTIFVFAGDGTAAGQDAGITLQNGQRLLGEGVGLKVNGVPLVDPFPNAVMTNATLNPAGDAPVVLLADNNEVAGFTIDATFNEGILALGGGGYRLHRNTINCNPITGREGIRLLDVDGASQVLRNIINGAPRDGIRVANNEDQAGNPTAPILPMLASLAIGGNTVNGPARDGIAAAIDGLNSRVELQVLTNTINTPGTALADAGIAIDSRGPAEVLAVLSRNTVAGSTGEAVDLVADGTSSLAAFVANNTLSGSGTGIDFRAAVAENSAAGHCLELTGNTTASGLSVFQVMNNALAGLFDFFEGTNDTAALRVGTISNVPPGTCGVPLDGAFLFTVNCTGCHTGNGIGAGNVGPNVTKAPAALIADQLLNNPTMRFIRLTPLEVEAIASALALVP